MKLRLALAFAIVLAGGAIATDRVSHATPPKPATLTAAPAAGIVSCPYLTEGHAPAFVSLANIGSSSAQARIGIGARQGAPLSIPVTIQPGSATTVRVPAAAADHAAAVIEYSGGPVVATHTLFVPPVTVPVPRPGGAAAASCGRAGGSDVAVAGASTFGSDADLALFNPGSADADVTVTLFADGRVIQPLRLAQRIVAAHTRLDFRLGDFAFSVRALTAVIHANVGRVVAEVLQRTSQGIELLAGQAPATQAVAISGQSGSGATAMLLAPGPNDAGIDARLLTADQQTSVAGVPPDMTPASGRVLSIPDHLNGGAAAYVFDVTVGSPVIAATTWTSARGALRELASLPAISSATKWGAVVDAFPSSTRTRAIIVNPGGLPAQIHFITIGANGGRDLTVPAGRLEEIAVARSPGTFAVLVDSDVPVVLAMVSDSLASIGSFSSFAVLGQSFSPPEPEAVVIDPRVGVPAVVSSS